MVFYNYYIELNRTKRGRFAKRDASPYRGHYTKANPSSNRNLESLYANVITNNYVGFMT
ncbi:MAG: hypothetical protein KA792_00385 [Bacteroidales bacterium]|nr:hypothetical protein [Bacteroidales bacterium]